jgi:hypothetical protein
MQKQAAFQLCLASHPGCGTSRSLPLKKYLKPWYEVREPEPDAQRKRGRDRRDISAHRCPSSLFEERKALHLLAPRS